MKLVLQYFIKIRILKYKLNCVFGVIRKNIAVPSTSAIANEVSSGHTNPQNVAHFPRLHLALTLKAPEEHDVCLGLTDTIPARHPDELVPAETTNELCLLPTLSAGKIPNGTEKESGIVELDMKQALTIPIHISEPGDSVSCLICTPQVSVNILSI